MKREVFQILIFVVLLPEFGRFIRDPGIFRDADEETG